MSITPFLWFDKDAEAAVQFYTSLFKSSKVGTISRYGDGMPLPKGTAMTVGFQLEGRDFVALNGGPTYQLTPAYSMLVSVETQEEVDLLWDKLTADGGQEQPCGWLVDRFGLSWQIIPTALMRLMSDPDPKKAGRVAQAMFQMKKIDIARLKQAYESA
jgi:predicted 3-demethylubiquinone-9 3-methyltransferase (glyoxalase superfamily)